jgi:hypothetical protein
VKRIVLVCPGNFVVQELLDLGAVERERFPVNVKISTRAGRPPSA